MATLGGVERPQLHRELMLAGIAVANECCRPGVEVLFGVLHTLGKRRRCRPIEDTNATAWAFGDFDAVETSSLVLATGTNAPNLPRRQRIAPDLIFALKFRGHHKLFDSIMTKRVAELRVAKLRSPNPFLLFLD